MGVWESVVFIKFILRKGGVPPLCFNNTKAGISDPYK